MSASSGPDIIESGLVVCLDAGNRASYSGSGTVWTNLTNKSFNATLPATVSYNSSYSGGLFLNNSQSGSVAWNNNGITSDFTIDSTMTILCAAGTVNDSAMFNNEVYLTRGFRSGFTPATMRYSFRNNESVPGGTANTFSLFTPSSSITYGVPVNITLSFNTSTSAASIFLNGAVSASITGRKFFPLTGTSNLTFNATQNSTNTQIFLHSLKIYNRGLTPEEILQNYKALKGRFNL
jgi:hypothetical protein